MRLEASMMVRNSLLLSKSETSYFPMVLSTFLIETYDFPQVLSKVPVETFDFPYGFEQSPGRNL